MGAIDGIHIPVMVGVDEQGPFRNKNGLLSQCVLAACSFDLRFHYVLAGWEGSASDVQVLNSAITRRNKLQVPEGIAYLAWIIGHPVEMAHCKSFCITYKKIFHYVIYIILSSSTKELRLLFFKFRSSL